jgi:hypothetical protein
MIRIGKWEPILANKSRRFGWQQGFSRREVLEKIASLFSEGSQIEKIKLDDKDVTPRHKEALFNASKLLSEIAELELTLKPGDAKRDL